MATRQPTTWRGIGILSRKKLILEAYDDPSYAVEKFARIPPDIKESKLVLVTATLEKLTSRQVARILGKKTR